MSADDSEPRLGGLTPEGYRRACEIAAGLRRVPPEEREGRLAEACAGDPGLAPHVRLLVQGSDGDSDVTRAGRQAVAKAAARAVDPASMPHPEAIGPYRIVQVLGEGGMGTVYEAERTEVIQRRVALKVIKLGMDTREVVARFEAERQALAVMDHPSIARALDAGATADGRPYFVMELVRGEPLTAHCDRAALSVRERIELFIDLCQGVQHAHHKGVIHRDLKPSNVLVTEHDGKRLARIIDFGVAKAVGMRLTPATLVTGLGQAIGTPAYMSPEQAGASGLDVDTRTDVYSLGVMLYELLVGALPMEWSEVDVAEYFSKLARHETKTPTPSARLTALGGRKSDVAQRRRTNLGSLRRELRGDLDWIVMKALDPDRSRRYETASALAADLRRYLDGEPVLARRPSLGYAARKFVRRHRASVVAASLVVVALIAGLAGTTYGLVQARHARDEARREAATSRNMLAFLLGLFAESDPFAGPLQTGRPAGVAPTGAKLTAADIVDRGVDRLRDGMKDDALVRARLLEALGEVQANLGFHDKAEPLLRESVRLVEGEVGPDDPARITGLGHLARVAMERSRFDEAMTLLREQLRLKRLLPADELGRTLGPQPARVAITLCDMATVERLRGNPIGARRHATEALGIARTCEDDHAVASSLHELAASLDDLGDAVGSRAAQWEALELVRSTYGSEHPHVATALNNLCMSVHHAGDLPAALGYCEQSLQMRQRILGEEHPDVAESLNNLARVHQDMGHPQMALPLLERALDIQRKVRGPEHELVGTCLHNIAKSRQEMGDVEGALPLEEQACAIFRKALGPRNPRVAVSLNGLAKMHKERKELALARPLFEESLSIYREAYGEAHPMVAMCLNNLASLSRDEGDLAASQARYEECLAVLRKVTPPGHPDLAYPLTGLGTVLRERGRLDESAEILREALDRRMKAPGMGAEHPLTRASRDALVATLRQAGRAEEAATIAGVATVAAH